MATYMLLSGMIFLIVGILHLFRVIKAVPVQLGAVALPMWVSWLGTFVTLALGIWGISMAAGLYGP